MKLNGIISNHVTNAIIKSLVTGDKLALRIHDHVLHSAARDAIIASRQFIEHLHNADSSVNTIMESLARKHEITNKFESLTNIRWPL